jgi:hypothetical protein
MVTSPDGVPEPPYPHHLKNGDSRIDDEDRERAEDEIGKGVLLGPTGEVIMHGGIRPEDVPDFETEAKPEVPTNVTQGSEFGISPEDLEANFKEYLDELTKISVEISTLEERRRMSITSREFYFNEPGDQRRYDELTMRQLKIRSSLRAYRSQLSLENKSLLESYYQQPQE